MKKLAALFILLTTFTFAQSNVAFEFDYAQFAYDSTSNYIEIYYSFSDRNEADTLPKSDYGMSLEIIKADASREKVVLKNYRIKNSDKKDKQEATSLVGVISFVLPEGTYKMTIKGYREVSPEESVDYTSTVNVSKLYNGDLSISNIELATKIVSESTNTKSLFYKNTLEVVPNPLGVFTAVSPVVFYYCELYNLETVSDSAILTLRKTVKNSRGRVVYNKFKPVPSGNKSIVEIGLVNMKKHPTDSYALEIVLYDSTSGKGVASTKKFYMINPGVKDTLASQFVLADYLETEYGVYSEEELDHMFKKCKYVATGDEVDQFEMLDSLDSKREFFYKFWQKRDPDPQTPVNEYKEEYMKRLKYVDAAYTSSHKRGYRTDMGRVYLMYGEPDQVDRYPNETNMKPHEIWYYNSIEGGVNFIFGDISGFSDYELLSSTKRGEITDVNWTRRIYSN